jgi:hypothetical protein
MKVFRTQHESQFKDKRRLQIRALTGYVIIQIAAANAAFTFAAHAIGTQIFSKELERLNTALTGNIIIEVAAATAAFTLAAHAIGTQIFSKELEQVNNILNLGNLSVTNNLWYVHFVVVWFNDFSASIASQKYR